MAGKETSDGMFIALVAARGEGFLAGRERKEFGQALLKELWVEICYICTKI